MKPRLLNSRRFITASGSALAAAPLVAAKSAPEARIAAGIIDCQSHLFFHEVIELMRRRKTEPLVYDRDGMAILKMGDWLRKVPPPYTSVEAKLAAMDAGGIETTLLSTNDPGPEWCGDDGPAVAQLIHNSLAGAMAKHPRRFRGLCTLPLQSEKAAAAELDRCVQKLGFVGILLYTNLAGAWCDEPQFHWLYARAEELDHVEIVGIVDLVSEEVPSTPDGSLEEALTTERKLRLEGQTKRIEIVNDLKTANRSPQEDAVELSQQLALYAPIRAAETGKPPDRVRLRTLLRTRTGKVSHVEQTGVQDDGGPRRCGATARRGDPHGRVGRVPAGEP